MSKGMLPKSKFNDADNRNVEIQMQKDWNVNYFWLTNTYHCNVLQGVRSRVRPRVRRYIYGGPVNRMRRLVEREINAYPVD